jgi:RNA polymerase-associated protein RTF1
MADLDAELLALAGGDDSSDEEVSMPSNTKPVSPTPPTLSNEQQQPNTEEPTADMGRRGIARAVKRTKKAKRSVARDRER